MPLLKAKDRPCRYNRGTSKLRVIRQNRLSNSSSTNYKTFLLDSQILLNNKSLLLKRSRLGSFTKLSSFVKYAASFSYSMSNSYSVDYALAPQKKLSIECSPSLTSGKMRMWLADTSYVSTNNLLLSRVVLNASSSYKFKLKSFSISSVINSLSTKHKNLNSNITPWIEKTLTSFISSTTGMRPFIQIYSFLSKELDPIAMSLYRNWLPRLSFYQKRLGHRFFMEETLHIMHLSLKLHDATLFSSWLTSLINRISFWKTRSIFRYLVYLFKNFFLNEFAAVGCKGLKIRLKGKISAAGNSRKRRINFKFGKVSYSTLKNKCLSKDSFISTFTGVMCLRTEIFY